MFFLSKVYSVLSLLNTLKTGGLLVARMRQERRVLRLAVSRAHLAPGPPARPLSSPLVALEPLASPLAMRTTSPGTITYSISYIYLTLFKCFLVYRL